MEAPLGFLWDLVRSLTFFLVCAHPNRFLNLYVTLTFNVHCPPLRSPSGPEPGLPGWRC